MRHIESKIQKEIVRTVRLYYPMSILFAVPNGSKRNIITASILKDEGVLAGVSDLILLHKGKVYFLEVKQPNGKQSIAQMQFEGLVKDQGHQYFIVTSAAETIDLISKL